MQTLKSTSAVSPRKRRSPALLLENIAPDSATGISSSSVSPQKRRALQPLSSNSLLSLTSSTTVNPPVLCFKRTLQPVNFNKPQVVPGSNAISKPFCKSSQNVRQQSTSSHVNKTPGVMRSTSGHVIQIVRTSNTVISSSVSSQKRKALQPLSNNNLLSSPTSAVPVNQSVLDLQRNLQAVNFNKPSQNNVRQSTSSFVNKSSPCIAQSTSGHVTNQIVSRTSSVVQQPISSLVNITGPVITQSNDKSGHVTKIVVSRSQVVGQKSTSNPVNSAAITRSVPVSLKQSSRASVSIPKPDKHNLVVPSDDGDYHQTPPALPRNLLFYESSATAVLPQHDLNCGGSPNNTFQQGETRRSFPNTVQHSSPAILKFHKNVEEIISKDTLSPDCRVALKPARKSLSLKKTNVTTTSAAEQGSDLSNKSLREDLMASLPSNYNYHIVSVNSVQYYHKQPDLDQSSMFSAIVRVNLKSKAEAEKWLDEFKESSFTDWRVRRTFPENTKCLIFKKGFRCNHNTLAQYRKTKTEAHKKHTECDAYICITVKNFNMNRSKDKLLEKFPCEISIEHCHNHPIVACDALRFRRPDKAIEELFKGMFRRGHSPSTALHTHQYDLQVANPTTFFEDLADGAKCPNLQWCYYQYRKMFKKEYGEPSGLAMLDALRSLVAKYNEDCGSVCAKVETFGSEVVLVLCSPLMKRVHEYLKASGEMTFLDSGGMMDRQNSRVFTFLAPSVAGALPVGMIITSSEAEDVLTFGMQELLTILPSCAFYGRGAQGPVVGMTDDSTAERNSLKSTFPDIILLLCLFHILSAFWRYVWESKHKVDPKDKEEIFFMFKHWCLTKSQEDFEKHYNELLADPRISGNKYLKKHIEDLSNRAPEWALWYRNNLLVRGNNTDNYSEAAIRRFKEDIMNRVRAYSLTQLFDFFTTRLEAYFERRIAAVLNNRQENYWKSKHFIKPSKLAPLKCFQRRDTMFEVHNTEKKTKYIVDIGLELCTCPVGFNGAPCKHQYAVVRDFNLSSTQFLPFEDVEAKAVLHKIMTTTAPKPGWYAPLKSGPTSHRNEVNDGDVDGAITLQCMAETNETASSSRESLNTPTETNEVAQKEALEALEAIYESLKKGLMEKPDVFTPAVQRFSELFHKAEGLSQNALLSAMHTFGNECVGMAYLQGRYIKVNKAGVIRRKYAAMAGSRKCAGQGRPRDAVRTGEHGYSKSKTTKAAAWDRFPPRSSALPHDLTERVQLSQRSKKK